MANYGTLGPLVTWTIILTFLACSSSKRDVPFKMLRRAQERSTSSAGMFPWSLDPAKLFYQLRAFRSAGTEKRHVQDPYPTNLNLGYGLGSPPGIHEVESHGMIPPEPWRPNFSPGPPPHPQIRNQGSFHKINPDPEINNSPVISSQVQESDPGGNVESLPYLDTGQGSLSSATTSHSSAHRQHVVEPTLGKSGNFRPSQPFDGQPAPAFSITAPPNFNVFLPDSTTVSSHPYEHFRVPAAQDQDPPATSTKTGRQMSSGSGGGYQIIAHSPDPDPETQHDLVDPDREIQFVIHKPGDEEVIKNSIRQDASANGIDISFLRGPNLKMIQNQKVYLPPKKKTIVYVLMREPEIQTHVEVMEPPEEPEPEVYLMYQGVNSSASSPRHQIHYEPKYNSPTTKISNNINSEGESVIVGSGGLDSLPSGSTNQLERFHTDLLGLGSGGGQGPQQQQQPSTTLPLLLSPVRSVTKRRGLIFPNKEIKIKSMNKLGGSMSSSSSDDGQKWSILRSICGSLGHSPTGPGPSFLHRLRSSKKS